MKTVPSTLQYITQMSLLLSPIQLTAEIQRFKKNASEETPSHDLHLHFTDIEVVSG